MDNPNQLQVNSQLQSPSSASAGSNESQQQQPQQPLSSNGSISPQQQYNPQQQQQQQPQQQQFNGAQSAANQFGNFNPYQQQQLQQLQQQQQLLQQQQQQQQQQAQYANYAYQQQQLQQTQQQQPQSQSIDSNSAVCRMFVQGFCKYGAECRYLHTPQSNGNDSVIDRVINGTANNNNKLNSGGGSSTLSANAVPFSSTNSNASYAGLTAGPASSNSSPMNQQQQQSQHNPALMQAFLQQQQQQQQNPHFKLNSMNGVNTTAQSFIPQGSQSNFSTGEYSGPRSGFTGNNNSNNNNDFNNRGGGSSFRDNNNNNNNRSNGNNSFGNNNNNNNKYDRDGGNNNNNYRNNNSNNNSSAAARPIYYGNPMERDSRREKELFGEAKHTTAGVNFDKYDEIPVDVSGADVPTTVPMNSFADVPLPPVIRQNVELARYDKPTPVQKYALPVALAGRDAIVCASTGSGKTAAFLFPLITMLLNNGLGSGQKTGIIGQGRDRKYAPIGLILAPTRELATQIYDEAVKFSYTTSLHPVVVYGGQDIRHQFRELDRGCEILVATCGRLMDFCERGRICLSYVNYLVFDEADRMLDMGFEPQIRSIVQQQDMTENRQTLMFSATFPKEIQRLAMDFLYNYIFIAVGKVGSSNDLIQQNLELIEDNDKPAALLTVLPKCTGLTLIFVERKKSADILQDWLQRSGIKAASIHGDRSQNEREHALNNFRTGRVSVLVATDVAARGLDISNVNAVINFDMPNTVEDYVHRIGRTGRCGNNGIAYSFANIKNLSVLKDLYEMLLDAPNQLIPDWMHSMMESQRVGQNRNRKPNNNQQQQHHYGAKDYRSKSQYGQGYRGPNNNNNNNPAGPNNNNNRNNPNQLNGMGMGMNRPGAGPGAGLQSNPPFPLQNGSANNNNSNPMQNGGFNRSMNNGNNSMNGLGMMNGNNSNGHSAAPFNRPTGPSVSSNGTGPAPVPPYTAPVTVAQQW